MAGFNFGEFLQSPGGSSIISAVLGGFGNMGAARSQERMNQQQLALQQAMLNQQRGQGMMDDTLARDKMLLDNSPLGWAQGYQQNTLLKNLMLQKLLNQNNAAPLHPNADVQARLQAMMGQRKPLEIPAEWQQVNPFGVDQTMGALGLRQGGLNLMSQGRGPQLDFGSMGLTPDQLARFGGQQSSYQQQVIADAARRQQQVMDAMNMDREQPGSGNGRPQGPSMGSRLGGAASGAMTGAKIGSFLPGLGTGIGAAIGGLVGLFKGGFKGGPVDPAKRGGGTQLPSAVMERLRRAGGGIQPMIEPATQLPPDMPMANPTIRQYDPMMVDEMMQGGGSRIQPVPVRPRSMVKRGY